MCQFYSVDCASISNVCLSLNFLSPFDSFVLISILCLSLSFVFYSQSDVSELDLRWGEGRLRPLLPNANKYDLTRGLSHYST